MSETQAEKINIKLTPAYKKLIEMIGIQKTLGKPAIFLSGTWDLLHHQKGVVL